MNTDQVPSTRKLMLASCCALGVAIVVLVVAVLPAEYGIDPLGMGRKLGLTALSRTAAASSPTPPPEGHTLAPVPEGPFSLYPGEYNVDAREFVLGPYEYVEFKYQLAKDATMLFSWVADGDILHDLHGVPDGAAGSAEQSFDKRARRRADGSYVAPFAGIHGWFWENPGAETVRVRLTTAGFYSGAHEFSFNGTRQTREIRALDAIPVADEGRKDQ